MKLEFDSLEGKRKQLGESFSVAKRNAACQEEIRQLLRLEVTWETLLDHGSRHILVISMGRETTRKKWQHSIASI